MDYVDFLEGYGDELEANGLISSYAQGKLGFARNETVRQARELLEHNLDEWGVEPELQRKILEEASNRYKDNLPDPEYVCARGFHDDWSTRKDPHPFMDRLQAFLEDTLQVSCTRTPDCLQIHFSRGVQDRLHINNQTLTRKQYIRWPYTDSVRFILGRGRIIQSVGGRDFVCFYDSGQGYKNFDGRGNRYADPYMPEWARILEDVVYVARELV